jgi:hypothetical protein
MSLRKTPDQWRKDVLQGEPLSSAEWLMLGVCAAALTGAILLVLRAVG